MKEGPNDLLGPTSSPEFYGEKKKSSKPVKKIKTGYRPRKLQAFLHGSLKRFNVLVCHRRFGKTVFAINHLIDRALKNNLRNPQYGYIAPTYKQARTIAWQYLVDFTRNIPGVKHNKSELTVYIERPGRRCPIDGCVDGDVIKIILIGADDPDALRGLYLDGCIVDEYAQCDPIIWGQIIRPALSDRARAAKEMGLLDTPGYYKPWAIFIGTPKGQNHFFRRYKKAGESQTLVAEFEQLNDVKAEQVKWDAFEKSIDIHEYSPENEVKDKLFSIAPAIQEAYARWREYLACKEWFCCIYRASETGVLSRFEIDEMKQDLEPEEIEQELECSFSAAIKGSYFGHHLSQARKEGRVGVFPYNPKYPVDTYWDIGVSDKTVIWFRQKIGGGWVYIDHFEFNGKGIPFYLAMLRAKANGKNTRQEIDVGVYISGESYQYGRHVWPHDGAVREFGSGQSRQETARSLGLIVEVDKRHAEADQIQAARNTIDVSSFDEEKCGRGLECLYNYQKEYDEKRQMFKDKPLHDWSSHSSKAFCYSAMDTRKSKFPGSREENTRPQYADTTGYDPYAGF